MATNFPTGLDTYVNPSGSDHLDDSSVLHSLQHSNVNDATTAIETKLGINFSSTTTTIDFIAKLFLLTYTQHPDGGYRELVYVNNTPPIISSVIWYVNSGKTIKLVEKTYTYGSNRILPTAITLKIYGGTVANILKRTITDTITYDRVFETSRARVIS